MIYKKLKKVLGNGLKKNIPLRDFTTLKVGGEARYLYEARRIEDLIKAIITARDLKINYIVLGVGSNILVSDEGFKGFVILNRTYNISFIIDKAQIIVDSGVNLSRLIMQAAEHNLGGIESLFGIPGTIGGAVYGNVGAHGIEISQYVKSITLLNTNGKIIRCRASWLQSGYRVTKLKKLKKEKKETPIILSIKLQFMPVKKEEIIKKIGHYQKIRQQKQPYDQATCGSVFKNPTDVSKGSAGYILDQLDFKGKKIGKAQVSKKHANFIENRGGASADDVKNLIDGLKGQALEEGVRLEEEIEYVGEFN